MDCTPSFSSSAEESAHWKSVAEDFRRRYEESAEELEEFQISSRELEAELEAQLEQAETKVRELTSANQRLVMENESLAERNREIQGESHRQINSLAEDLGAISKAKEDLVNYVRELEMSNDSLENSKRQTISTLEDFEQRLNQALERNAYLENELEEKDQLQATIQRFKDEARDLRLEMSLKKTRSPSNVSLPIREAPAGGGGGGGVAGGDFDEDDNKLAKDRSYLPNGLDASARYSPSPSSNASRSPALSTSSINVPNVNSAVPHGINPNGFLSSGSSMLVGSSETLTPTARITALNIVGDLLRKVGSLEMKLASCRTSSVGSPMSSSTSGLPMGSPKQRATTIGAEFSPAGYTPNRPRANAVSAPKFVNCENYV